MRINNRGGELRHEIIKYKTHSTKQYETTLGTIMKTVALLAMAFWAHQVVIVDALECPCFAGLNMTDIENKKVTGDYGFSSLFVYDGGTGHQLNCEEARQGTSEERAICQQEFDSLLYKLTNSYLPHPEAGLAESCPCSFPQSFSFDYVKYVGGRNFAISSDGYAFARSKWGPDYAPQYNSYETKNGEDGPTCQRNRNWEAHRGYYEFQPGHPEPISKEEHNRCFKDLAKIIANNLRPCPPVVPDASNENCELEFVIYNANENKPLHILKELECIEPFPFNIQVQPNEFCPPSKSAKMELSGPRNFARLENMEPYLIFGDVDDKINGRGYIPGDYNITASLYSERRAKCDVVAQNDFHFTMSRDCVRRRNLRYGNHGEAK